MSQTTLEQRIQRLEDIEEIKNLFARRCYYHTAARHDLELTECWTKRDDWRMELEDWGLWIGRDSVWKAYVDSNPFKYPFPGLMSEHTITTGVIEVAGDGETAKAIWISPGHETVPIGDGDPIAHWCWNRYGVDFIRDDDGWKIWHIHIYSTLRTPYDTDWVRSSIERPAHFPPEGEGMPGMHPPDAPITFNQPYRIDEPRELQPFLPQPYETWADTHGYTDPDGVSAAAPAP